MTQGTAYYSGYTLINGAELWKTDGTIAGTQKVVGWQQAGSAPRFIGTLPNGDLLYTAVPLGSPRQLYRTDGTASGTVGLGNPGGIDFRLTYPGVTMQGDVFFQADGPQGFELWKSDGTAAGTVQVADIQPGAGDSSPGGLAVAGGVLVFGADDGTHGRELWASDGTAAGTAMVADLWPAEINKSSDPRVYGTLRGRAYLFADDGVNFNTMWVSDGTTAGTQPFATLGPPGWFATPSRLQLLRRLFLVRSERRGLGERAVGLGWHGSRHAGPFGHPARPRRLADRAGDGAG